MGLDVETEIIASCLNPEALLTYHSWGVDVSHFADEELAPIYEFANDYFFNYGSMRYAPTVEIISDRFPKFLELIKGAEGAAPQYLAKKLKDLYCSRQVMESIRLTTQDFSVDTEEKARLLRDSLSLIVDSVTPNAQRLEYGKDMELYNKQANINLATIGAPYPFEHLNKVTRGIKPGELVMLVAAPKKGKSWFAAKTVLEAVRMGWSVYFASLELDIMNMARRLELLEANRNGMVIPINKLNSGEEMPSYIKALEEARKRIEAYPGKLVIDKPKLKERTPSALVQNAKIAGCNFMVVDQLQFVKNPNSKARTVAEQTSEIIYELKDLIDSPADNIKMPMLMLHQLNREGIKGSSKTGIATAQDIANSEDITRVADLIWTLGQTEEDRNANVMKLVTLATRNIAPMGFKLRWDIKYTGAIELLLTPEGNPKEIGSW